MKAPLVFVLLMASAVQAHAKDMGVSDQRAWEANWRELQAQHQLATNNDFARHEIEEKLIAYGQTLPPGTQLNGWLGRLSDIAVVDIKGVGQSVVGQLALTDWTSRTPHVIWFAQKYSQMSDAWRAKFRALSVGETVEISGTVLEQRVPTGTASIEEKRRSFIDLFRRAVEIQFGKQAKEPESRGENETVTIDDLFQNPEQFGVSIHLLLSDIKTAVLSQEKQAKLAEIDALLGELDGLASLHQDLVSDSDAPGIIVGEGLIGRVRARLDCKTFLTMKDYAPCPDFEARAREVGCACPEAWQGETAPGDLWKPWRYERERGRTQGDLALARDAIGEGRLVLDQEVDISAQRDWIASAGAEMRWALSAYTYLDDCLTRESKKWEPGTPAAPAPSVSQVAIAPPQGLRWGMTYEEAKATTGKLSKLQDSAKEKKYEQIPPSFRYAIVSWRVAGQPMDAFLLFDKEGRLQGVFSRFAFTSPAMLITAKDFTDPAQQRLWPERLPALMDFWRNVREGLGEKYGSPAIDEGDPRALQPGQDIRVVWQDSAGGQAVLRFRARPETLRGETPHAASLTYKSPAYVSVENQTPGDEY